MHSLLALLKFPITKLFLPNKPWLGFKVKFGDIVDKNPFLLMKLRDETIFSIGSNV